MVSDKYKSKKIVIATHIYATGPTHALEDFLKEKVAKLIFIGHPFVYAPDLKSHMRLYHNHKKVQEIYAREFSKNQFLSLIKDMYLTIYWVMKSEKYDIFIGADVFNAFAGILLKKTGFVKKTVFYTIDYIPQRFTNKIMNYIYHALDTYCVKNSDLIWNLSDVMIYEREQKGIQKKYRKKQILVPMGTTEPIQTPIMKVKQFNAVHMGHLIPKQGMQLVIEAMPKILEKIPNFRLDVLGSGYYEKDLKTLAKKIGVAKFIKFHGYIKNHADIERMLPGYALGFAPYTNEENNYIQYTDPGKVKAYLSAGLPIIITRRAVIADEINKKGAGIAIEYDLNDIVRATVNIMKSRKELEKYRSNVLKVAQEYTWDKIFTTAFSRLV